MGATGTALTRLVVLRGNSGSGKSSVARRLQEHVATQVAWVEQDHLRRVLLCEEDIEGGAALGLVDQTVRYVLDHEVHVVLEGLLVAHRYGPMLRRLRADHRGVTRAYYLDITRDESVRRHAVREQNHEVPAEQMSRWYRPGDLVDGLREHLVGADADVDNTVARVLADARLAEGGPARPRPHGPG